MDADLIFMCPLNLITVIITVKRNLLICKTSRIKSHTKKSFWDGINSEKKERTGWETSNLKSHH